MTEPETNHAVVAKLMAILSGDAPIEAGAELLSPEVVAHVDGWRFQGINVWANWIRYLRTRGRLADPEVVIERIETHSDGTVTAHGRWTGRRGGCRLISKPCAARYRITEGRIVEIWSTRRNYALLCGGHVEHRLGFTFELLRVHQWKKQAPQLDLTSHARVRQSSFAGTTRMGGLLPGIESGLEMLDA